MKHKISIFGLSLVVLLFSAERVLAQAKVMNPGEAVGQLVYLSQDDVISESAKYKGLSPLSIPVFESLPTDMSVVAGAITLKQQNLLSHVQLKSRARGTPNLDISSLENGLANDLFKNVKDGDWVRMLLTKDGLVTVEASTEQAATDFYQKKKMVEINLTADVTTAKVFHSEELGWKDSDKVGSKSANYAELMKAVNTGERSVVRPGFGIPFHYYQEFIDSNPKIKDAIEQMLMDPLMKKVAKVTYRDMKLRNVRTLMQAPDAVVNPKLVDEMVALFDQVRDPSGLPHKMKLRSSTNSEDLPNFSGAGLYDSFSYKPNEKGVEKLPADKALALTQTLRQVWSSVWTLRAFDERSFFQIPHEQVKMAIQVNPSFGNEAVNGVVVTKNVGNDPRYIGAGVYIEAQRGEDYSVTNPVEGIRPEKILVLFNASQPMKTSAYVVRVLQRSNVADDLKTIMTRDNPKPIMSDDEIKDLAFQVLKAHQHFKPLLGADNAAFALDSEFKVDTENTGERRVYLKQTRPYLD